MRFHASALAFVAGIVCCGAAGAGTIQQTIVFTGVSPETVYDTYLSSKGHAAMTGFPAAWYRPSTKSEVAVAQEGDEFRGFGVTGKDGKLHYLLGGRVLKLVPGREIVMSWRPAAWDQNPKPGDGSELTCILVLTLTRSGADTQLDLVQTDIPDLPGGVAQDGGDVISETSAVNSHWWLHYWTPMQKYFDAQSKPAPKP